MDCKSFLEKTILTLDEKIFMELRDRISKKIRFEFFNREEITAPVMAEKLTDYFYTIEKSSKRNFESIIEEYYLNLDFIVVDNIAKQKRKSDSVCRARAYYEMAKQKRKKVKCFDDFVEYSRLMMCLYSEIIKSNYGEINDFNFSFESIDVGEIISSFDHRKGREQKIRESSKILTIIVYYHMKNNSMPYME